MEPKLEDPKAMNGKEKRWMSHPLIITFYLVSSNAIPTRVEMKHKTQISKEHFLSL